MDLFLVIVSFSWSHHGLFCSLSPAYLHPYSSPLSHSSRAHLCNTYMCRSAALEKLDVVEQCSGTLHLTLTTAGKFIFGMHVKVVHLQNCQLEFVCHRSRSHSEEPNSCYFWTPVDLKTLLAPLNVAWWYFLLCRCIFRTARSSLRTVSYTHLTLPTIYSV